VWVVLEFPDNAVQQRHFHDHEGFTVCADCKPFMIMAGSRGGAGALVVECLVLQERPFPRTLARVAWPERDREYPRFALA
jgi:hypothetical protein